MMRGGPFVDHLQTTDAAFAKIAAARMDRLLEGLLLPVILSPVCIYNGYGDATTRCFLSTPVVRSWSP